MAVTIKNLYHSYDYSRKVGINAPDLALKDINLTIEDGEFVALMGQTGSGKTTLVKYLNGLFRPMPGMGKVIVNGIDTEKKDLKELRKHVGMVFQRPETQLFEETVFDDIAFGLRKSGISEDEIAEKVNHIAEVMDLSDRHMKKSPFELSFGQKRRVAIAGVAVMQPNILVLDEPMAGLDPAGRTRMMKILKNLHRNEHNTIIMISHSMENIAELASRVVVLNNGCLVLDGPVREVFARTEFLKSISLDVPDITEFMQEYSDDGICLNVEEAVQMVKRLTSKQAIDDGFAGAEKNAGEGASE